MKIFNMCASFQYYFGRKGLAICLLFGGALALNACGKPNFNLPGLGKSKQQELQSIAPTCPTVQVRPGAEAVGVNGPNGTFQMRIVSTKSACEFRSGQLETQIKVLFETVPHPTNRVNIAEIPYFVSANDGEPKSRTRKVYFTSIPLQSGRPDRSVDVIQHLMPSGASQTVLQIGFVHQPGIQPLTPPPPSAVPPSYQPFQPPAFPTAPVAPIAPVTNPLIPGTVEVTPVQPIDQVTTPTNPIAPPPTTTQPIQPIQPIQPVQPQ